MSDVKVLRAVDLDKIFTNGILELDEGTVRPRGLLDDLAPSPPRTAPPGSAPPLQRRTSCLARDEQAAHCRQRLGFSDVPPTFGGVSAMTNGFTRGGVFYTLAKFEKRTRSGPPPAVKILPTYQPTVNQGSQRLKDASNS
ncbi:hypothetical protein DL770_004423 [Monosporascus sp. CRB-9-2]|nr:hypothetical protein DL770_004423 [Monosporascus sp. CRB-9-2]